MEPAREAGRHYMRQEAVGQTIDVGWGLGQQHQHYMSVGFRENCTISIDIIGLLVVPCRSPALCALGGGDVCRWFVDLTHSEN